MTQRTSLIEQYNNRDVIAQIYRIIDIAEHGAIESLNVEKTGAIVRLIFTMHDGTVHPIEFPANGIADITSVQDGSTMNVTITLDDGTERTISWTIVPGVTLDTAQTVTGAKTFSALMTLLAGLGITGTVTIDGDTQITNGHGLSVAGDIDSAGTLKGDAAEIRGPVTVAGDITAEGATVSDQAEIAGMAIEPNGSATKISNDNGISSDSPVTLTNIPTTDTGVRDTKPANGTRVMNDLDAYEHMVRTSGNFVLNGRISLLQDSLIPITNLNGISKGFLKLSGYVNSQHSAAFIIVFRGGCSMVAFSTNTDNTAISSCSVYGSSINNLGLVVAKDDAGVYLGFSGLTSNAVATITNMVLYRSGFVTTPTEVDIDISNMTKVQVVPT